MTTTPFAVENSPLRTAAGADAVPHPLLIEASAGSGKTWALSHLAVRFMLEDDVQPDEMLLVTFTRDAARTLRGRVREQLSEVLRFLERYAQGTVTPEAAWQVAYASFDEARRAAMIARGRSFLGRLDGLHAQTIDSFAAEHADVKGGRISDGARQWQQASNEVFAALALRAPDDYAHLFAHTNLWVTQGVATSLYHAGIRSERHAAEEVVTVLPRAGATLEGNPDANRAAVLQRETALAIVSRFVTLMEQSNTTTFSELIVALAERLASAQGAPFVDEMRKSFRVVMIDEFQDTNPLQWVVFRSLFLDAPDTRFIMVGDPKQAIYGFRSGSVETFMAVRELCRQRGVPISTLQYNHRSAPDVLAGVNGFFAGTDFHYDAGARNEAMAITFTPALPFPGKQYEPHTFAAIGSTTAPVHLRVGEKSQKDTNDELVAYVRHLQAQGVPLSQIAVLCYGNHDCRTVQKHLVASGIPATTSAEEDVYKSEAAFQLRLLLVALANPDNAAYTEVLRATWFRAGTGESDEPGRFLFSLAQDFADRGVAAIVEFLTSPSTLATLATTREAERNVTDLLHLSEVLAREGRLIRAAYLLVEWLDDTVDAATVDESGESRRLETESDSVRVMTAHKAKGLEFDAVLVPYLAKSFPSFKSSGQITSRRDGGYAVRRWIEDGRVVVDAGSLIAWGTTEEYDAREDQATAWQLGESRRLAYVALTRAKRHLVSWLNIPGKTPFDGEFVRMHFDRDAQETGSLVRNRTLGEVRYFFVGSGRKIKETNEKTAIANPVATLESFFSAVPQIFVASLEAHLARAVAPRPERGGDDGSTDVTYRAGDAPSLPSERRRWSYTDLKKELSSSNFTVGSDDAVEVAGGYDEVGAPSVLPPEEEETVAPGVRGVFGKLAGARLGAAVHAALEFTVGVEGAVNVDELVEAALRQEGFSATQVAANREVIVAAIDEVITRPTHPLLESASLRSLAPRNVAKEMRFVLSVGDVRRVERLRAVARAVHDHDTSGDGRGLFREYFAALAESSDGLHEGFLVGSLDLVVRRSDGRFSIVDYKTDQMAGDARPFRETALHENMQEEHYPLQAVLYSVALHRHLRATLPGYRPEEHLAGVGYYYLRVVGDPSREGTDGFAAWPISPAAVVAASDAMEGIVA